MSAGRQRQEPVKKPSRRRAAIVGTRTGFGRSPNRRDSAKPPSTACSTNVATSARAPIREVQPGHRRPGPSTRPGEAGRANVHRRRGDVGAGTVQHARYATRSRRSSRSCGRRWCDVASTSRSRRVSEAVVEQLDKIRRRGSHGVVRQGARRACRLSTRSIGSRKRGIPSSPWSPTCPPAGDAPTSAWTIGRRADGRLPD